MDRVVYRVRGIPSSFSEEHFKKTIVGILSIEAHELRCRSFASDTTRPSQASNITAIITFHSSFPYPDQERFDLTDGMTTFFVDNVFDGFTPVSSVASAEERDIDCIVLPGWGGHPIGSFMSQESSYVWILDGLAKDYPQCSVWTYGYSPALQDQASGEDVHEFADTFVRLLRRLRSGTNRGPHKKAMIIIAHSLGGLVFKEAIVRMDRSSDEHDRANLLSIYGAMFFGVPNLGMDVEAIAAMIENLPARTTLHDLDRRLGHRARLRLHSDFCDAFHFQDSVIARFYELEPSPTVIKDDSSTKGWSRTGPPRLLVDFDSATKARKWEDDSNICGLRGNHSTMVKLPAYPSTNYEKICGVLDHFIELAPMTINSRFVTTPPEINKGVLGTAATDIDSTRQHSDTSTPVSLSSIRDHITSIAHHERADFLNSLSYPNMSSRQTRVDHGLEGTYQWLSRNKEYNDWMCGSLNSRDLRLLWIKGKPGSGKSTLMKHISVEICKSYPEALMLSFFFDARASDLEKTPMGLYRALLCQTFEQAPEVLASSIHTFRWRRNLYWTEQELAELLHQAIFSTSRGMICLLVDALDECDEEEHEEHTRARQSLEYLEKLLYSAHDRSVRMLLALSSRHYPHISVSNDIRAHEMVLESENHLDIRRYAASRLGSGAYLQSAAEQNLLDQIAHRSRGIFLWAVLVTTKLKTAKDRGLITQQLREILDGLPQRLFALFEQIMSQRSTEEDHLPAQRHLIKWILFARKPLDIESLQMALRFDGETPPEGFNALSRLALYRDFEHFKKRVLDLSRGLVEFRQSEGALHAYFIHETARAFFQLHGYRLLSDSPEDGSAAFAEQSHHAMAKACAKFFSISEMRSRPVLERSFKFPDTPRLGLDDADDHVFESTRPEKTFNLHELNQDFPFWRYAVSNLFFHIRATGKSCLRQEISCQLLDQSQGRNLFRIWERFYSLYSSIDRTAELEYRIFAHIQARDRGKHSSSLNLENRRAIRTLPHVQTNFSNLTIGYCIGLWGLEKGFLDTGYDVSKYGERRPAIMAALIADRKETYKVLCASSDRLMTIFSLWRRLETLLWDVWSSSGPVTQISEHSLEGAKILSAGDVVAASTTLSLGVILDLMRSRWRWTFSQPDAA